MKRRPSLPLALALTGALAVVVARRSHAPVEPDPPSEAAALAAPLPETLVLRSAAKRRIALEVAAGRRSLVEAAALFGALNRVPPEPARLSSYPSDPYPHLPRRTEEEWLCRQVISHAERVLVDRPAEAAAAVARLEAEFWDELRRHGVVRLPDDAGLPPARELLEQARTAMNATRRQSLERRCPLE